jgi:hypothetical protein
MQDEDTYVIAHDSYPSYRHTPNELPYCEHHAFQCADCNEWFVISLHCYYNAAYERICERCCSENYYSCDECGCIFHIEDTFNRGDTTLCQSCYEDSEDANQLIHEYEYKPSPVFYKAPKENIIEWPRMRDLGGTIRNGDITTYFGVELEVDDGGEFDEGVIDAELDIKPLYYCKHDGSLHNGFEVVSHPATWQYWRQTDLGWMNKLIHNGYRSYKTETCGMHIHVNRSALSQLDIFKLLAFCKANPKFIHYISRRHTERDMNQWARVNASSTQTLVSNVKTKHSPRYNAINLLPRNTIEFRIFRGTLDNTAFLRNIAFVHTLIQFVKTHSIDRNSASAYSAWLKLNAERVLCDKAMAKSLIEWIELGVFQPNSERAIA